MAITMVTSGLTREAVLDPAVEIAFPDSVVHLFHGDLGQPVGGFPPDLQKKVLGGKAPLQVRPGELLPPADLEAERKRAETKVGRSVSDYELASYLMYPKVFAEYAATAPRSATSARCRRPCSSMEWSRDRRSTSTLSAARR